jgi:hypothetical protein
MTVVDRPTTSEQFFGRFHAHGFPDRWEMPSIYITLLHQAQAHPSIGAAGILLWSETGYRFIKRQSQANPTRGSR